MLAEQLTHAVTEVKSGRRLVQHSAVLKTGEAIDGNARGSALRPASSVRNTGKTIRKTREPKRRRRNCAGTESHPIAKVVGHAEPKFVQHGWADRVCPANGGSVIVSARNRFAGRSNDDVT